ncbi:NAD-dependent epimerase/dehydratase family protein [Roseateles flavus]|uniref:NAD-dependent epimerase/dehydratase family protein n=1 Tax=Roseateles flavus TaxID=3149041 RepID=A0ABV0GHT6_9BURK
MKAPALVTGATGIVGNHIVRALLEEGHPVRVLVREASDRRALAGLAVQVFEGDVLDVDSVQRAATGCDWVFHAAAVFAYTGMAAEAQADLAVRGTRHVLLAAQRAGVGRVVVTSSSVTLGSSTVPLVLDEDAVFDEREPSDYVQSKLRQEEAAFEAGVRLGLEVLTVNPTLVIGAHDHRLGPSNANLVNYLNDPLRCTFLGGCNVVAAPDVGQAHLVAALRGEAGRRYVAGSENLRWEALHALVSELAGTFGPTLTLNHTAAYLAAAGMEAAARLAGRAPQVTRDEARMACRFYWYRHERLAALGWRPRPARKALAEALAWVLARGHVSDAVTARLRLLPEVRAAS